MGLVLLLAVTLALLVLAVVCVFASVLARREGRVADAEQDAVCTGSLLARFVHFEVILLFPPGEDGEAIAHLEDFCARPDSSFHLADSVNTAGPFPAVMGHLVATHTWPSPDLETILQGGHRATFEGAVGGASEHVLVLDFVLLPDVSYRALRESCRLVGELAERSYAIIWDQATCECFTPDEWQSQRVDAWDYGLPCVGSHIAITRPEESSSTAMTSLGMAKFGLPDVLVRRVSPGHFEAVEHLIRVVCHSMTQSAQFGRSGHLRLLVDGGAGGTVELQASLRPPAAGPTGNRLLEVVLPCRGVLGPGSISWASLGSVNETETSTASAP